MKWITELTEVHMTRMVCRQKFQTISSLDGSYGYQKDMITLDFRQFSFSFFLLSVLRGHSVFFHPSHNGQWPGTSKDFLSQILSITERASIFPFEFSVVNKGTTGTIFITSLVWRGPWLGIEPTLEASTIPLGYRGGGDFVFILKRYII